MKKITRFLRDNRGYASYMLAVTIIVFIIFSLGALLLTRMSNFSFSISKQSNAPLKARALAEAGIKHAYFLFRIDSSIVQTAWNRTGVKYIDFGSDVTNVDEMTEGWTKIRNPFDIGLFDQAKDSSGNLLKETFSDYQNDPGRYRVEVLSQLQTIRDGFGLPTQRNVIIKATGKVGDVSTSITTKLNLNYSQQPIVNVQEMFADYAANGLDFNGNVYCNGNIDLPWCTVDGNVTAKGNITNANGVSGTKLSNARSIPAKMIQDFDDYVNCATTTHGSITAYTGISNLQAVDITDVRGRRGNYPAPASGTTRVPLDETTILTGGGNLILYGTYNSPIELGGTIAVRGNVFISGYYTGVGAIYAEKNIYVVGPVIAKGSTWKSRDTTNNLLGLFAKNCQVIGDYTTYLSELNDFVNNTAHVHEENRAYTLNDFQIVGNTTLYNRYRDYASRNVGPVHAFLHANNAFIGESDIGFQVIGGRTFTYSDISAGGSNVFGDGFSVRYNDQLNNPNLSSWGLNPIRVPGTWKFIGWIFN